MSNKLELTGQVKLVEDTQTFNSGFTKREFVITTDLDTDWPQDVKLEVVKDKCAILDDLHVGQEVTVSFNVRGNEYNGRHYVNLQCWKLVKGQLAPQGSEELEQEESDDEIPF